MAKAKKTKRRNSARKPAKKKAVKRKPAKRKPAKKQKRRVGRKLVKQVEKRSVERVLSGTRKRKRARKRRVVMAGPRRRRSVGKSGGGSKLLIGLAIGAAAIYFLTKKSTPTYPINQLPPLTSTQNYTRNTQSQDIVNYAMAGGLAIDAIIKLIDKLNNSTDNEVEGIYDVYRSTGNLDGVYV